jgi:hypothetical protein
MAQGAVDHAEITPGMFRVHYRVSADLSPALQSPLIAAVEVASRNGPTAILFVLEPGIRTVELSVPSYWLEVTARRELNLIAFAIVTQSAGVKVAAKGFAMANLVRRIPLEVRTFEVEAAGLAWLREAVATRYAQGAA